MSGFPPLPIVTSTACARRTSTSSSRSWLSTSGTCLWPQRSRHRQRARLVRRPPHCYNPALDEAERLLSFQRLHLRNPGQPQQRHWLAACAGSVACTLCAFHFSAQTALGFDETSEIQRPFIDSFLNRVVVLDRRSRILVSCVRRIWKRNRV